MFDLSNASVSSAQLKMRYLTRDKEEESNIILLSPGILKNVLRNNPRDVVKVYVADEKTLFSLISMTYMVRSDRVAVSMGLDKHDNIMLGRSFSTQKTEFVSLDELVVDKVKEFLLSVAINSPKAEELGGAEKVIEKSFEFVFDDEEV